MLYDSLNVLGQEATPSCVVQKITLAYQEVQHNAGRNLKTLKKCEYPIVNTGILIGVFPLLIVKF